jgi:hypothetical protein
MIQTRTIEDAWLTLKAAGNSVLHTRVDETHPLELYAEFEQPNRPGLVLFCSARPPEAESLKTVEVDQGIRPDGKWWMRISLRVPELEPVFAALCRDIVAFTRSGVDEAAASSAILRRLSRWRALLEGQHTGLSVSVLRGLIGELLILELDIIPTLNPLDAVMAWSGPLGTAQDFVLPNGHRIEVKAVRPDAVTVTINGLDQLDSGGDPLTLVVLRLLDVGRDAAGAETASGIIARLEGQLKSHPAALSEFGNRLAMVGWHENPAHENVVVRFVRKDIYAVEGDFPRLIRETVLNGIDDANYSIRLPRSPDE